MEMIQLLNMPKRSPRWQIVSRIQRQGRMTVGELVEALGVTTTAVRQQVDRLGGDGVLAVSKRGGRRGRPCDVFALTEHGRTLFKHKYDEMLGHILRELTEQQGRHEVGKLLRDVGVRMADSYADRLGAGAPKERMQVLVELLVEQGIAAEVDENRGDENGKVAVLRQFSCPYYEVAKRERAVCGVDEQMLSRLLGPGLRRTRCLADGDTCCEFELKLGEKEK